MIATHLIRLGSRVVDKTMVIGETGSPFSQVDYRHLCTQTPDEKFKANTDCIYYVIVGDRYRSFNSLKGLVKIFKQYKYQIKEFSGQHSIDFDNPDDVSKLLGYIYSL